MAAAVTGFDVREIDGLAKLLNEAKLSSQDRSQLLHDIGVEVVSQTQERFDTPQVDPEGNQWKALAEKTVKYYERHFPGMRRSILVGEGYLRDTITSQVNDWSVLVGATMVYAATHNFGRGNIPARPFLGISTENAADIQMITRQFLAERLK
jgi:phage virion morphogenesis protein